MSEPYRQTYGLAHLMYKDTKFGTKYMLSEKEKYLKLFGSYPRELLWGQIRYSRANHATFKAKVIYYSEP